MNERLYQPLKRNLKIWKLNCILVGIRSSYTIKQYGKLVTPCDISTNLLHYTEVTLLNAKWKNTEWLRLEVTTGGHLDQPPCSRRVSPEHRAHDCVQTVLEHLQWGRFPSFSGQCVPVWGHPHGQVARQRSSNSFRCIRLRESAAHFSPVVEILPWYSNSP